MARTRLKNQQWTFEEGKTYQWEVCQLAVLMDIRDELQRLNALLHCHNFTAIPDILRTIRKNTAPRKRKAKPKLKAVA